MRRQALVVAMTAIATLLVPLAAAAQVDEPDPAPVADVDRVKERAARAIDRRLDTIDRLRERITAHPHVSGPHQGALLGELGSAQGGLQALSAEIATAGSPDELRDLVPRIATDFRIYLVVLPKVAQVLGSDTAVAVGERLEEGAETIAGWIERAAARGIDVTEAEAHLAAMESSIESLVAVGAPVAESVLPLEASDWPDPAEGVLAAGRADLEAARDHAKAALDSGRMAIRSLRDAFMAA